MGSHFEREEEGHSSLRVCSPFSSSETQNDRVGMITLASYDKGVQVEAGIRDRYEIVMHVPESMKRVLVPKEISAGSYGHQPR